MASIFEKIIKSLKKPSKTSETSPQVEEVYQSEATVEPITQPRPVITSETAPLSPDALKDVEEHKINPAQLLCGCGHSVGLQRDHNEDALFSLTTTIVSDTAQMPFGFYVIADGMGGHQHGEIASGQAIRAMSSYIIRKLYMPLFSLNASSPEESLQELMQEAVMEAHQAILKDAAGGGTTLTAALILGNQLMISHVGDSRAYAIFPEGRLKVLTRDHSLVKRLEELGQITSAEAALHPQRNVLYRALGQGEPFEPDISTHPLPKNGYIMLCSDGLWGVISEDEILDCIRNAPTPEISCQRMVNLANEAGGPDNITVILVKIPE